MHGDALYSIGDLARRTGLSVKTIRFYSERGIVPPAGRSPAGYRLYSVDAVARLDLVRTLRDLGLDLATIRKVVDREVSLADVAEAHAEALLVQIRVLRLRRAVLSVVAKRDSTPDEMGIMYKLAKLSEEERRRLIDDYLDSVFGDLRADPAVTGIMRTMTPELPDNPEVEQVEAWVELAELCRDPQFRAGMRRIAQQFTADRADGNARLHPDAAAMVRDRTVAALAEGIDPTSRQADRVVAEVASDYARFLGRPDDADLRRRLLSRLETANDPRRERYFELLSVINGWSAPVSLTSALDWFVHALQARMTP